MRNQAAEFETALQGNGFKLTAARQTILQVLAQSGGHVTADELADKVRAASPGVGRMTVYRTLDVLCRLNLIRPVYQGTGAAHYVLMADGHHHHLVCSGCGAVIEFDDCVLTEVERAIGGRYQFQVQGHLLEFFGVCAQCQGET